MIIWIFQSSVAYVHAQVCADIYVCVYIWSPRWKVGILLSHSQPVFEDRVSLSTWNSPILSDRLGNRPQWFSWLCSPILSTGITGTHHSSFLFTLCLVLFIAWEALYALSFRSSLLHVRFTGPKNGLSLICDI